jgi:protein-L-isoaspartate(D-aspartate) O-methyltransferase
MAGIDVLDRGFAGLSGPVAGAHRAHTVAFDEQDRLEFDDVPPADAALQAAVLGFPPTQVPTRVEVGGGEPFDDLQLYLAASLPRVARLVLGRDGLGRGLPEVQPGCPVLADGAGSIAYLTMRKVSGGLAARSEFVAVGLGPAARSVAVELAGLVGFWNATLPGAGAPQVVLGPIGALPDVTLVGEYSALHLTFPPAVDGGRW